MKLQVALDLQMLIPTCFRRFLRLAKFRVDAFAASAGSQSRLESSCGGGDLRLVWNLMVALGFRV